MTENEVNQLIVRDASRIITSTEAWTGRTGAGKTCVKRDQIIADMLNAGRDEEILQMIKKHTEDRQKKDFGSTSIQKDFRCRVAKNYIEDTEKLIELHARAKSEAKPVSLDKEKYDLKHELDDLMKKINVREVVFISFRTVEIAGGIARLEEEINKRLSDKERIKIAWKEPSSNGSLGMRRSVNYLGRQVSLSAPMVPIVTARKIKINHAGTLDGSDHK